MKRPKAETILTVHEAAAIIRGAFGKAEWTARAWDGINAAGLVAALWVAQNDSGKERLGDLIRWARRMK